MTIAAGIPIIVSVMNAWKQSTNITVGSIVNCIRHGRVGPGRSPNVPKGSLFFSGKSFFQCGHHQFRCEKYLVSTGLSLVASPCRENIDTEGVDQVVLRSLRFSADNRPKRWLISSSTGSMARWASGAIHPGNKPATNP